MKTIPLTKGYEAIVDDEDFERLNVFKWTMSETKNGVYAIRVAITQGKPQRLYMHREIVNAAPGFHVDHRDGNGLHNWRDNLRSATQSNNQHNRKSSRNSTSKFKGVSWHAIGRKWQAHVQANHKRFYLGLFETEEQAAMAVDTKARIIHGEFGRFNFPRSSEQGALR